MVLAQYTAVIVTKNDLAMSQPIPANKDLNYGEAGTQFLFYDVRY